MLTIIIIHSCKGSIRSQFIWWSSARTRKLSYRKMTAWWVPWKFSKSPRVRPLLLFPKFLTGFCSDRHQDVRTKFEVRSFTPSW